MLNKKIYLWSLLNALGVLIYVSGVSFIIVNGQKFFGQMKGILGPMMFLLLFVLSAAIVGALVLGRPILLYLDGQKKQGIIMFGWTLGWLFAITVILFTVKFLLG